MCRICLAGLLEHFDASQQQNVLRAPSDLSEQFMKVRNAFAAPRGRYSRFGYYDTMDFENFMQVGERIEDRSLNIKEQKALFAFSRED